MGCNEKHGRRALENAELVPAKINSLKEGDQTVRGKLSVALVVTADLAEEGQLLRWKSPRVTSRAKHWKTVVLGEVC